MKIAIPTRNNAVDNHFGHCEYYTIFLVVNNRITDTEIYQAPKGCGCKSNVASVLAEKGVNTLLAGNMGQGAVNKITSAGIKVIRGCSGDVTATANNFINNKLSDSGITCDHHHHHGDSNENRNCHLP